MIKGYFLTEADMLALICHLSGKKPYRKDVNFEELDIVNNTIVYKGVTILLSPLSFKINGVKLICDTLEDCFREIDIVLNLINKLDIEEMKR